MDSDRTETVQAQVRDLQEQVTAFAGLSEALREVDGVLGQISGELARSRLAEPLRTRWTGPRDPRAVSLA